MLYQTQHDKEIITKLETFQYCDILSIFAIHNILIGIPPWVGRFQYVLTLFEYLHYYYMKIQFSLSIALSWMFFSHCLKQKVIEKQQKFSLLQACVWVCVCAVWW